MLVRSLLGLTVLAAAAPAWAEEVETAAPIQAVVQEFGDEVMLAFYTPKGGNCDIIMLAANRDPGTRVRVSLAPKQAATIEDVSGAALKLTCGLEAAQMLVERTPAQLKAANAKQ